MLALSSRSTTFMGLGDVDELDTPGVQGPSLDDEVIGGVASGW